MTCMPIDKMDTPERLEELARCIREFGPDIRNWGNPDHVADTLEGHAAKVRAERILLTDNKRPSETEKDNG